MRAVLRFVGTWLLGGHAGQCASCKQMRQVWSSIDGRALLCRWCSRRSFGSAPYPKGRL